MVLHILNGSRTKLLCKSRTLQQVLAQHHLLCFCDWTRQQIWRTFPIDHSDWVLLRPVIPWRWRPLLPKQTVSVHPRWRNVIANGGTWRVLDCNSSSIVLRNLAGSYKQHATDYHSLRVELAWLKFAASKRVTCARTATRATVTRTGPLFVVLPARRTLPWWKAHTR